MNKKQQQLLINYLKSSDYYLNDVYTRWSIEKEIAYDRIRCECAYNDGFDLRICSANTFAFTMAYSYYVGDKVHLRYHTRDNVYDFEIEE